MFKSKNFLFLFLFLILLIAISLRFWNLSRADVLTDEILIAFRSIGYIDFFSSPYQTTPWEWFSDIPNWARLSFHDHPPLVFLVQHVSFKLLGQNLIALRLPFVLAGVASVFLLYLVGKKLFNEKIGLIAALLLAVSSYHVWISRIGLQESIVIFLTLLCFYLFLMALENNQHWRWGIGLGLALLTKYTAIVLIPIFGVYILLFKRSIFKDKRFWLAVIIAIIIFSPVLIYNLKLYQARGHFDLQFSYLFGQEVPEWQYLPGKIQAGNFFNRLQNLIPALYKGMMWPMFILLVLSFFFAIYKVVKKFFQTKTLDITKSWLVLIIIFYGGLFLLVGPSKRFVSTVVPFAVLLISWFIFKQKVVIKYLLIIFLVGIETFFVINTLFTYYPIGKVNFAYSYVDVESYNWGYNQLNNYLVQLLRDKRPAITFPVKYQFLQDIKEKALAKAEKEDKKPVSWLLIYDTNMYNLATFWLFHRQLVYQAWPVITAETYIEQGHNYWLEQGVEDFYFFKIFDGKLIFPQIGGKTTGAEVLADQLSDIEPDIIKRPDGREVFAVYYWQ